jgi:hypothetical protein
VLSSSRCHRLGVEGHSSLPLYRRADPCLAMKRRTYSNVRGRNSSLYHRTKLEQISRGAAALRAGYFDRNFSSVATSPYPPPSVLNQFYEASLPRVITSGAVRCEHFCSQMHLRGYYHEGSTMTTSTRNESSAQNLAASAARFPKSVMYSLF